MDTEVLGIRMAGFGTWDILAWRCSTLTFAIVWRREREREKTSTLATGSIQVNPIKYQYKNVCRNAFAFTKKVKSHIIHTSHTHSANIYCIQHTTHTIISDYMSLDSSHLLSRSDVSFFFFVYFGYVRSIPCIARNYWWLRWKFFSAYVICVFIH